VLVAALALTPLGTQIAKVFNDIAAKLGYVAPS
jgi:hypothetical protein